MTINRLKIGDTEVNIMYRNVDWEHVMDIAVNDVMITVRTSKYRKYIAETAPSGVMDFAAGYEFDTMEELIQEIAQTIPMSEFEAIELILDTKYINHAEVLKGLQETMENYK